jgi:hypothetical protein
MAEPIQVILTWINSIKIDPEYLKLANLLLIILILVTGGVGLIALFTYLAERRRIPMLIFDGVWSDNPPNGIEYYIKVEREKGEGRAQGVQGFVGVKKISDQKVSMVIIQERVRSRNH